MLWHAHLLQLQPLNLAVFPLEGLTHFICLPLVVPLQLHLSLGGT